ncbi:aminoglycoside phosphotransferase (APT) family kinase protein [Yoonia maricola]|uniref:Aminoglycoside phosphotransferase (APT) family kinase protein n=1 Tax=Yoonia maricola TaxID=420999 RepID=A0A2M8WN70_9RHOB|nr:phosphotransferase family protein [Yoonia maricola]PJI92372.1 aminoglycoside phosphotransferase (APT) family kinase protein [Yoonia maricola]
MKEAAQNLGISLPDLDAYLTQSIAEFEGLKEVTKFGTGQSNPTYQLNAESGTYVLRSKPPGRLLPSAHAVDREFRVMDALAGTNVPVPEVLHLADTETSPSGRAFFVMRYLPGRIFWDPALPDCEKVERSAIYDAMNAALAAMHDVDVDAVGLGDYGRPGNYFARQLDRWSSQYLASVDAPTEAMSEIIAWLGAQMPADDGQVALVHGDWRLDNMIFRSETAEIAGILDWELSTLGHPMADLAYQCMQWRLPNQGDMRGLAGVDRAALGLPSEAQYVADYAARRGLERIDGWPFYLVFAFFRLAAILAGVAARAVAGNASNPTMARKYGAAVPALAAMATIVMHEGAEL